MEIHINNNEEAKWLIKALKKSRPKKGTELVLRIGSDVDIVIPKKLLPKEMFVISPLPRNMPFTLAWKDEF